MRNAARLAPAPGGSASLRPPPPRRELTRFRVNRVSLRKEYFRIHLDELLVIVRRHHGAIEYVAEPAALEYRETLTISPEALQQLETDLAEMGVHVEEEED